MWTHAAYQRDLGNFSDLLHFICFLDKDKWTFILESMMVHEKVLKGFRKRKRDEEDEEVLVISSSLADSCGATVGD